MGFVNQLTGGGGSSGPAPDYTKAAVDQGAENRKTAEYNANLNRVDQTGPGGSLRWTQGAAGADGSPGRWTQTMTLDPTQQALYDTQQNLSKGLGEAATGALGRATGALSSPMDISGLPALSGGPNAADFSTNTRDYGKVISSMRAPQGASAGNASSGRKIARTFDQSGIRALPGTIDDTSRRRVEEALMSRLNPQLQRDEAALRTRLLNSGIEVGTDAYNRELNNFGQKQNDARMQAILAGGQEESRQVGLTQGLQAQEYGQKLSTGQFAQNADAQMAGNETQASIANANNSTQASISNANAAQRAQEFQIQALMAGDRQNADITGQNFRQGLAGATLGNSTRAQGLTEATALRNQPLNELNALRSGAQVSAPTFGSYYTGASAGAAPIFDATVAQGNANAAGNASNQGGINSLFGGLAGMGSAWLSSDVRLKKNIVRVGDHPAGVGRYTWDWKDGSGSSTGVLAQELQGVRPDAVRTMANGYLGVAYGLIGGQ